MFRYLFATLLLGLTSCSVSPKRLGHYYQGNDHSIGKGKSQLKMHFTGAGGFIIEKGTASIMVDPFFSNPSLLKVGMKTLGNGFIKPNSKNIAYGLRRYSAEFRPPKALLISHAHYDHLMDVPILFKYYFTGKVKPKVYGNRTSLALIHPFVQPESLVEVEGSMASQQSKGSWLGIAGSPDSIRVLPIQSQHAPHKGHLKLYNGENTQGLDIKDFDKSKTKLNDWREGQTLAYLIDFMEGSKIDLRLFVQTSASDAPWGFPLLEELEWKKVDVAFLCAASYELVENYPAGILNHIQPDYTFFIHWENFFRNYRKGPRIVPGTKMNSLIGLLDNREGVNQYFFPAPGVNIDLNY